MLTPLLVTFDAISFGPSLSSSVRTVSRYGQFDARLIPISPRRSRYAARPHEAVHRTKQDQSLGRKMPCAFVWERCTILRPRSLCMLIPSSLACPRLLGIFLRARSSTLRRCVANQRPSFPKQFGCRMPVVTQPAAHSPQSACSQESRSCPATLLATACVCWSGSRRLKRSGPLLQDV